MKIVGISDLHGHLDSVIDLPAADVYCICGDIVPLAYQDSVKDSVKWLKNNFAAWCFDLPCNKVFFIAGNHDFALEILEDDEIEALMFAEDGKEDKIMYLKDNMAEYNGIKFYGTPWCPDLKNWAFYNDHDGLVDMFGKIPEGIDVLMSHCPPKISEYGTVRESGWNFGNDYGCSELADRVKIVKPRLHIFGHVHSGSHVLDNVDGTMMCNVSILNENYSPFYYPTEINI